MEKSSTTQKTKTQSNLRIIPLGGLGEVGRNMMLLEYPSLKKQKGGILIIDVGLRMPEEDMPGIDYIIPNTAYLKEKKKDIVGAIFTHGHYDHIGAIPYLVSRVGLVPMFASKLAKGIILKRQENFPYLPKLNIEELVPGKQIKLGPFLIEPVHQAHNIPEDLSFFIKTPVGNIFHTSDFKFDEDPINGLATDFQKLKEISRRKILLLMSDSTGAEQEGHSLSESTIFENLDKIFKESEGRIISSTFASHIHRVQQLITLSEKYGRKVIVEGSSMKDNVEIARNLRYIKTKKGTIVKPSQIAKLPDKKISFICTGAQGEEGATLMRITTGQYKFLRIKKGDAVIFSSSVIPGNERAVQFLKDDLFRQGAKVFHYQMMDIHASGHAHREELAQMIRIMKPKFFLPIHGQYSMLVSHGEIAQGEGIKKENIIIAENGQVINLTPQKIEISRETVPSNYVMVDGLGIGDVGEIVLRDRQMLSKDGMFVIVVVVDRQTGKVKGSPDIISRGFVYLRESKELLKETRRRVINIVNRTAGAGKVVNWTYVKDELRNKVKEFLFYKTKRQPMVLPVVIEV